MKTGSSNKKTTKQRLTRRKPLFWRKEVAATTWRARYYKFTLTSSKALLITLRKFRTSPTHRSKNYRQLVLGIKLFGVKEIALRVSAKGRGRNRKLTDAALKPSLANVLLFAGLVGVIVSGLAVVSGFSRTPPTVQAIPVVRPESTAEPSPATYRLPESKPTRLTIPSINLSVGTIEVGQAEDGSLETPGLFDNTVGWYKHSPTPGEIGPAIIVGHVDSYKGPSVFWYLGKLNKGDEVRVSRQDGSTAKFRVTAIEQYSQDDFPTDKVYANTEKPELRLITCGGNFNYKTLRYTKNTVVYAELIP